MNRGRLSCLALFALAATSPARTETFTTADVVSRSVSKNCLDWQAIGTCFWLKCSPKCRVRTTSKIQHNLPDLTVAVYPHTTPWLEMRRPGPPVFTGGDPGRESRRSATVRFKDVDVIGNPAARFRNTFSVPFLCRSKTEPLKLYFSSKKGTNPILWRGQSDQLKTESWTPGKREIGNWPRNTWGSVYPRIGYLTQAEDPKAGAVIAQRAIDIVTREGQGFDYVPLGYEGYRWGTWGDPKANSGKGCHETGGRWIPPDPIAGRAGRCAAQRSVQWLPRSSEKTDRWQMISPVAGPQCETFGADGNWSDGKESIDSNYAFNYWREYKCCIPRSGKFLRSVEH